MALRTLRNEDDRVGAGIPQEVGILPPIRAKETGSQTLASNKQDEPILPIRPDAEQQVTRYPANIAEHQTIDLERHIRTLWSSCRTIALSVLVAISLTIRSYHFFCRSPKERPQSSAAYLKPQLPDALSACSGFTGGGINPLAGRMGWHVWTGLR